MNKIKKFFSDLNPITIPTIVMVVICIVVTGALAGTNLLTKAKIKQIEAEQQKESMKEVLKAEDYEEKAVSVKFEKETEKCTYYVAKNGETEVGYIYIVTEKGYGGDVKVMTAVNQDGSIKAVKVLDVSNETPGLGQNTGNEEWYSQFSGLDGGKEITVQKSGADKNNNEINAVTGATISSSAVTRAVNKALTIDKTVGRSITQESEGTGNE